ncbi:MAG: M48 family metalloprotease [Planctomycetes bacterium]|nr:M48 family metalloprotease [Planctomycetota bacterium]
MILKTGRACGSFFLVISLIGLTLSASLAQQPEKLPSPAEVRVLLQKEPITLPTWPVWRERLLKWFDDRSHQTDEAYKAVADFMKSEQDAQGQLTDELARDPLAWYFLGNYYLKSDAKGDAAARNAGKAEAALRKSIELDDGFARAHRNLAVALMFQDRGNKPGSPQLQAAREELTRAAKLDPKLPLGEFEAELAMHEGRFDQAERLLQKVWEGGTKEPGVALLWSYAIVLRQGNLGVHAAKIGEFVELFPQDGHLACLHGIALARDNQMRQAAAELGRARSLGVDPEGLFPPDVIRKIEEEGTPGFSERFLWILAYFTGFYAVVMALMALVGVALASRTRGAKALDLLSPEEGELVSAGQVARITGESGLAKLYGFALVAGLVLFYAAIPFIIGGLIMVTWWLLQLIFLMGRIPVKLVVIVVVVGIGGAWAVLKSVFSKPVSGAFGLPKTAQECPRVHQMLAEVAGRVNTDPINEVFIAPGAAIGVHQEGKGPFGIFGVKRRVLTLGLSTMRYLSVAELKAILAHEYAHFSHNDTFYGRFIYQVHMSIERALYGMGTSGGVINYVNPFYWFLFLYYKCYSLLAAGFSRSREFLADRMACSLYGSDVFATGLIKVSTDGTLFEKTIYDNISKLLAEQQAFVNMYDSFQSFRDQQLSADEKEKMYREILEEKGSLFASHPTIGERLSAVEGLPKAHNPDTAPARTLFDNPEEIEKELTQFLTDYMAYIHHLQAQAAAAAN